MKARKNAARGLGAPLDQPAEGSRDEVWPQDRRASRAWEGSPASNLPAPGEAASTVDPPRIPVSWAAPFPW